MKKYIYISILNTELMFHEKDNLCRLELIIVPMFVNTVYYRIQEQYLLCP